jgi:putative addiction module component (TIGR02574 family)
MPPNEHTGAMRFALQRNAKMLPSVVGNQGANMHSNIEELAKETMALDIEDRALLAGKLLLSLDEPTPSELERLWLDEAEHRLEDFRAGRVQGIPADEVFRRAVTELS